MTTYRNFEITYDPPPIPTRNCDWSYSHKDFDGPGDNRYGHAPSEEAAKADIDFWHEEHSAMTAYIQHRKTADEVVAELDAMITERLARNFGNMTLWHDDAATLLRRYREMAGEIETLRLQQQTDRQTIASLLGAATASPAERQGPGPGKPNPDESAA